MSQEISLVPKIDGRLYSGLPQGIFRWTAQVNSTGAGSGTMSFHLKFNNGDSPDFQRYASISTMSINCSSVALTKKGAVIWQQSGDWEDYNSSTRSIGSFEMLEGSVATQHAGQFNVPTLLGRVKKATTGQINIQLQEINLVDYTFSASGFVSDKPFLAPNFWRP